MSDLPPSDPGAARDLARVLAPDEPVLWAGRPDERHFTKVDGRLVALGVFWTVVAGAGFTGFALTFFSDEYAGLSLAVRVLALALAAAPFAAVSVFCLGGHVALRHRTRARTAYAVTARRVLALRPGFGGVLGAPTLRELALDRTAEPSVETVRRETGTVEIHDASGVEPPVRFDTVRGAEGVAALIRAQRSAGT